MTKEEAIQLIRDSALSEHAEALVSYLLPSARVIVHDELERCDDGSIASHFGGLPSLPRNVAWPVWDKSDYLKAQIASLEKRLEALNRRALEQPENIPGFRERRLSGFRASLAKMQEALSSGPVPLAFLGQLFLSEIRGVAPLEGWPQEGTLAFFYDAVSQPWGFDPLDRGHCRVLFFGEQEPVLPGIFPGGLADEFRFPNLPVTFECEWTLPTFPELESDKSALSRTDEYQELLSKLSKGSSVKSEQIHRVAGHPQEVQNEMHLECQLVTNGIYCGGPSGYQDPRRGELEKGAPDWRLLVQFDSDEKRLGWMWGDVGRIYFWARKQCIEIADFSDPWAILQCG